MDERIGNAAALSAAADKVKREIFLRDAQNYILRVTSRITGGPVTTSDEEWPVALLAVSEALDAYDEDKGNFWSFAGVVIKNRLMDMYRKNERHRAEISVRPEAFGGDVDEDDPDFALQMEMRGRLGVSDENTLREEILSLQEELSEYGISFFELTEVSPKAEKTRSGCAGLIASLFAPPPPLTGKLKKTKNLPVQEMLSRFKISRKIVERYRKYLIASALILDGDYPGLASYLGYAKEAIKSLGRA